MKTPYNVTFIFLLLMVMLVVLPGCNGRDPQPSSSKQDEVKNILASGTWKVQNVLVDGTDKTNVYKDLTLTFTSIGYSATHGLPVWPDNGSWTFTNDEATVFKRDDGIVVTIQVATETSLKLGLTWNKNTLGADRSVSVSGQHVFSFIK